MPFEYSRQPTPEIPSRPESVTEKAVEEFKQRIVEVGVRRILEAKTVEITAVAEVIEEKYGAISAVSKEQARVDPDFRKLLELAAERRQLKKEVLPQGVTTLLVHAEKLVEKDLHLDAVEVVRSVWQEYEEEKRTNEHFLKWHEDYKAGKQEEIDNVQKIIDLYEEQGLTDEDSQEILILLRHQKEYAEEDIRKHEEKTSWLVHDIEPLAEKAEIATDIIEATGIVSADTIKTFRAVEKFSVQ